MVLPRSPFHKLPSILSVTYCINSADATKRQEMCLEFIWKGKVKVKESGIFGGMKKDLMEETPLLRSSQTKLLKMKKKKNHSEEHIAKELFSKNKKRRPNPHNKSNTN